MRRTIPRLALAALLVCVGLPLSAQAPASPAPLTEIESLRVQNVTLKLALVRDELAHLKADMERVRPGWTWNPEDGSWTAVKPPTTDRKD